MKPNLIHPVKTYLSLIKKLTVIALFMLLVISCQKESDTMEPVASGAAPDFSLKALDMSQVMLSGYKNKVVVLFFFGNNCPSCKAAAPQVESMLVTPFKTRTDYQVLGLDQWNGNSASVQAFKTITGITFPLLLNAADVAASYKTTYDRLVVIDQKGEIVFSGTLGAANDIATVKQKVELLLGMKPGDPPVDTKGDAPDFTLNSLSGGTIGLSGYKNKVVVLFFFGNACPACKAAAPGIESTLVAPYASRTDYQVLGLDQWDGNTAAVQGFKTSTGVSFPLLLNASKVASDYKTTFDRLVVIDQKGNVVFKGTRGASGDLADADQKVKTLLGL